MLQCLCSDAGAGLEGACHAFKAAFGSAGRVRRSIIISLAGTPRWTRDSHRRPGSTRNRIPVLIKTRLHQCQSRLFKSDKKNHATHRVLMHEPRGAIRRVLAGRPRRLDTLH